jgi:hypothetical protein
VLKCRRLVIEEIRNIILKTRKESGIYNKSYINIVNDRKRLTYLNRACNIAELKTSYSSEIIILVSKESERLRISSVKSEKRKNKFSKMS